MDNKTRKLPVIKFERRGGTELYDIRFSDYSWAFLMLHEEIGIVSIVSDYGSWSSIWPPKNHARPSLKHFLCEGDFDYLAKKLMLDGNRREFDCEATINQLKKKVFEERWHRSIEKDEARSLYDELDCIDTDKSEDLFWSELDGEVGGFVDHDYGAYACHKPTRELVCLKEMVLPAIIGELRKSIAWEEATV